MKKGLSNLLNGLKKVTGKNYREWCPIYGMFEVPVNLIRETSPLPRKNLVGVNACYHALVSYAPLFIGGVYKLNQIIG